MFKIYWTNLDWTKSTFY